MCSSDLTSSVSVLHIFFENLGLTMPGRSTLTELVNAVGNETRQHILDAQVARVLALGWDDFSVMLQDSTHVEGNTAWPTDSRLLVALVERLLRVGASLPRLDLPAIESPSARRHLSVMTQLDREIDLAPQSRDRGRTRRRRYEKLLWRARRVHTTLSDAVAEVEAALAALDVLPSRKANAEGLRGKGVQVVSINGAKGRALTAHADWDSDEYALARDKRSAVESLMFTLKQGFHFGQVARRGLVQVHGELLEKAIAYNI